MDEQAKLYRVFSLIRLLKQRPGYTVHQLARHYECDKRTVYRYLRLLEELGYLLDEDAQGRKFIFEAEPEQRAFFTAEETALLRQALTTVEVESPLRESLRRKLYLTSDLIPLADELLDVHQARVVQRLGEAIRLNRRARLLRYESTNSGTVRDRDVEPIAFSEDFATLNAVDVESGQVRTYKTRRIQDVAVLEVPCTLGKPDEVLDAFGMSGPDWLPIELRLTTRAYRLLVEEHPGSRAFARPESGSPGFPYRFHGLVRNYAGVGRFVMGLPTEIEVVGSEEFRGFLREKVGRAGW